MSVGNLLRTAYLLYFSRPACDRALYKAVRGRPIRSIVELGIGSPERTSRLLEIARSNRTGSPIRYTGIDLFESSPNGRTCRSLKEVFAALKRSDVQIQLVPGDPRTALRRVANSLAGTDLLLIAADHDSQSLELAWSWMPRMVTTTSLIFRQQPATFSGHAAWSRLTIADLHRFASAAERGRRAA